jgi:ribonucleotide monophosphatase NagD (HAD superfamily)
VVTRFLDKLSVPHEAYDGIVSSGDVTRAVMAARPDKAVFHIGPERDLPIFDGLGLSFVALEQADYVVCTGCARRVETPESTAPSSANCAAAGCSCCAAIPTSWSSAATKLIYCAGALADLYGTLGGEVLYAGKPHRPIYDLALDASPRLRGGAGAKRVLAIGDSVRTDLTGATDSASTACS